MAETYNGTEGNAASAAGYSVMDGDEDWRDGWRAINKTRDLLAAIKSALQTVWGISSGGTGASTAAQARTNLGITAANVPSRGSTVQGDLDAIVNTLNTPHTHDQIVTAGGRFGYNTNIGGQLGWATDQPVATGPFYSPSAYNNPVTVGTYYALYVQPDGRFGRTPSAAKYKHDIEDYDGSVLGIRPVTYVLNDDPDNTVRLGVIADEADAIEPLLVQRADGEIEGFSYELLAVGLLAEVRRLAARVEELEAKL